MDFTDRRADSAVGDQPRLAAALPRTRLFEPSENTAMFRPQAAIASSADQEALGLAPAILMTGISAIQPK